MPFLPHLRQEKVTLIAVAFRRPERARASPGLSGVLPTVEATIHRHDVGVAELLQSLNGKGRPGATGAHHDHRLVAIGHPLFDHGLERAAGDVERSGNRTLVVLIRLSYVEQEVTSVEQLRATDDVDLVDLGLGGPKELPEAGHTSGYGANDPGQRLGDPGVEHDIGDRIEHRRLTVEDDGPPRVERGI